LIAQQRPNNVVLTSFTGWVIFRRIYQIVRCCLLFVSLFF